jgi:hypothetical protein
MELPEVVRRFTVRKERVPRTVEPVSVRPTVLNGTAQILKYLADLSKRIETLEQEVKELRTLVTPAK